LLYINISKLKRTEETYKFTYVYKCNVRISFAYTNNVRKQRSV